MTNFFNRGYSLFYMSMTAFCIVAGFGAIMAYFYSMDPVVDFAVDKVDGFGYSNRKFEEAKLLFNISADFSKLVHVNTRLFYAYIEAEWETSNGVNKHRSILWNKLVYRENPYVTLTSTEGSFTFRQVGESMKGKTIKLYFRFQLVPFIGFFKTATVKSIEFTLPSEHFNAPTIDVFY